MTFLDISMAYAAVVSPEQTIVKMLDNGLDLISVLEIDHMISIREYLISLVAFLEDFPDKAIGLEVQIRDIANAAEDALESFMLGKIQSGQSERVENSQQTGCKYMCFGRTYGGNLEKKHEFQKEFKKAENFFCHVTKLAMDLKNNRITETQEQPHGDSSIASSSSMIIFKGKTKMIGFQDDLQQIMNQVFGESSKIQVIPIVGMGGIGKTTLARTIYKDSWTIEHFRICVWVTLSQDYRKEEVLKQILPHMDKSLLNCDGVSSEEAIYKTLKGRRYLIVMDDMWNTKVWDDLRWLFPDDCNGSVIMLTRRILDVATYVRSNYPPHEMHLMDEVQSWNLLQQLVFSGESCPHYLENDGRMIARNCRGLPLAIVVIAGVSSNTSKTQTSWKNVTKNVIQAVMANDDHFAMRLVSLSYNHLPQHLRQCFLYMGCFPEDFEIYASKLTKLWVGEGFLKSSGSMSMEEWAEECLNGLVRRNLVLVSKKKSNGKIKSCGLHDLVSDSCIKKAHEEMFLLHINDAYVTSMMCLLESMKGIWRLCVSKSVSHCYEEKHGSSIRSIIRFKGDNESVIATSLPKLRFI